MRAWGLAKGLKENGLEVTVGINSAFPQDASEHQGVKIINWSADESFADALNSYDAIIVSYCMGSDSVFIADNINDSVLLVLDVYVPIYVEVSARNAHDMGSELRNYLADIQRFNRVLKRGDYFICANQTQKVFYIGVLGSLGVINPRSYSQDRILVVPFGVHNEPVTVMENPYLKLGIKNNDKVVLWFGGLYPWFRIQEYLDAVLELTSKHADMKFVFVGGKNPFNNNPDLLRQYELAVAFFKKHKILDKSVFFVDWVDFDTRVNWYKHADFVVSLNQPGEENGFSWRTRVMDYVWGELVVLTNGGDPLGNQLIYEGAAVELKSLTSASIKRSIESIYEDKKLLENTRQNLLRIKKQYYWDKVTKDLVKKIMKGFLPYKDELEFKKQHSIENGSGAILVSTELATASRLSKAANLPFRVIRHARQKGIKRSVKLAGGIIRNQLKRRTLPKTKDYIFISHPIDNSGAPLVLLQIIDEVRQKYGSRNIRVLAPYLSSNNSRDLSRKGIRVQKSAVMSPRLTGAQLSVKKDDFVFMNTAAIYENYRNYIFNLLGANRLKHAYWFIHEDIAQLNVVAPQLTAKENIKKIQKLTKSGKLTILVPSKRVKEDYDKLFGIDSVVNIPLRVNVPEKYTVPRKENDYSKINFLLSGAASDGRKGQLIALAAFQKFMDTYYRDHPEKYRDFSLQLVSIGDDYVSTQIKSVGRSVLRKKLKIYPALPRNEALAITAKCNAVICCSLNETFALYVAEGMLMGHVVLRNDSAGIDEQLKDGINGYFINSQDINQFALIIEKLLNQHATSDKDLYKMGNESQQLMQPYTKSNYLDYISLN